jgi:hypothetical protein
MEWWKVYVSHEKWLTSDFPQTEVDSWAYSRAEDRTVAFSRAVRQRTHCTGGPTGKESQLRTEKRINR